MPTGYKKGEVYKAIGLGIFLIGALITIFIRCLSKSQLFEVYILTGVGISLLFTKSAEKTQLSFWKTNYKIILFGSFASSVCLSFINPVRFYGRDDCNTSSNISLTVINHDAHKTKQDILLRNLGEIVMTTKNGTSIPAQINQNGAAIFQTVHIGDEVRFRIAFSEPYKSACPESTFVIQNDEAIYLPIYLEGIGNVPGRVFYKDLPLEKVIVSVGNIKDTTDEEGKYEIVIPENEQKKSYNVWFYKTGFKSIYRKVFPQSLQELNVEMEKL